MDMEVAIFLVIFLLTSSVATVAICCLELKAVWISYKDTASMDKKEPECTCSRPSEPKTVNSPASLPKSSPATTPGKYTRKESLQPTYSFREAPRQYSLREQPSLAMNHNWSNGDTGAMYGHRQDTGLELKPVGDVYRTLGRSHAKVQFQYDWPAEARGDAFSPNEQDEQEEEEEEQFQERYSHSVSPEGVVFNHAHGSF